MESRNKSYIKNKRKMINIEIKYSVKIIENRNKIYYFVSGTLILYNTSYLLPYFSTKLLVILFNI